MKHLKKFADNNAYNQFKKSPNYIWPNASKVDIDSSNFTMDYHKEENNIIRYWAPSKLPETTSNKSGGLHTDKFNTTITEHTFENGMGVIKFADNVTELKSTNANTDYGAFGNSNITDIILPSTVTFIGRCSFYMCKSLTTIKISNIITTIGNNAFGTCNNLLSIELPDSLTTIGDSAFSGCTNLTSIKKLPDSLTTIGSYAFNMCNKLDMNLTISKNVILIGSNAFFECNFKTIKVHPDNTIYDSRNNCNAIIKTNSNELIRGCNNTIIPNDIKIINSGAFSRCSLTSIIIPEGITTISDSAFENCLELTSIIIPEGVKYINNYAFSRCQSLTSIILPSTITSIGMNTFEDCNNLTSITILATTPPSIDSDGFGWPSKLENIYVPKGTLNAYNTQWANDYGSENNPYANKMQELD